MATDYRNNGSSSSLYLTEVLDRAAFVAQRYRRSGIGKLYLHAGALLQIEPELFARFVHSFNLRSHAHRRLAGYLEFERGLVVECNRHMAFIAGLGQDRATFEEV